MNLPKLVRDTIPDIIARNEGKKPKVRIVKDDKELLVFLLKKLVEEAVEVQQHEDRADLVKELADMKEVTLAVMGLLGISEEEIEKVRVIKKEENGGFEKGYILEEV